MFYILSTRQEVQTLNGLVDIFSKIVRKGKGGGRQFGVCKGFGETFVCTLYILVVLVYTGYRVN